MFIFWASYPTLPRPVKVTTCHCRFGAPGICPRLNLRWQIHTLPRHGGPWTRFRPLQRWIRLYPRSWYTCTLFRPLQRWIKLSPRSWGLWTRFRPLLGDESDFLLAAEAPRLASEPLLLPSRPPRSRKTGASLLHNPFLYPHLLAYPLPWYESEVLVYPQPPTPLKLTPKDPNSDTKNPGYQSMT